MVQMPRDEGELELWLANAYNSGYAAASATLSKSFGSEAARLELRYQRQGYVNGLKTACGYFHQRGPNAGLAKIMESIKIEEGALGRTLSNEGTTSDKT